MIFEIRSLFSENQFFFLQSFEALFVFFVSLSVGAILKIFIPRKKIKNAKNKSAQFTFACVFLTFSIFLYTILIFLTKKIFFFKILLDNHVSFGFSAGSYYVLLAFIFLWGILLSLFWKIVLPVSLILYFSVSFFSLTVLNAYFGHQHDVISLKIEENSFSVGDFSAKKGLNLSQFFVVQHSKIPDSVFLPIRRNWFFIEKIEESNQNQENPAVSDDESQKNEILIHTKDTPFLENPVSVLVQKMLLPQKNVPVLIPFPHTEVYPSLFSAKVDFKDGSVDFEISRDL